MNAQSMHTNSTPWCGMGQMDNQQCAQRIGGLPFIYRPSNPERQVGIVAHLMPSYWQSMEREEGKDKPVFDWKYTGTSKWVIHKSGKYVTPVKTTDVTFPELPEALVKVKEYLCNNEVDEVKEVKGPEIKVI